MSPRVVKLRDEREKNVAKIASLQERNQKIDVDITFGNSPSMREHYQNTMPRFPLNPQNKAARTHEKLHVSGHRIKSESIKQTA